jgi:hypothetical protein
MSSHGGAVADASPYLGQSVLWPSLIEAARGCWVRSTFWTCWSSGLSRVFMLGRSGRGLGAEREVDGLARPAGRRPCAGRRCVLTTRKIQASRTSIFQAGKAPSSFHTPINPRLPADPGLERIDPVTLTSLSLAAPRPCQRVHNRGMTHPVHPRTLVIDPVTACSLQNVRRRNDAPPNCVHRRGLSAPGTSTGFRDGPRAMILSTTLAQPSGKIMSLLLL